jgi:hypothetical protein
VKYPVNSTSLLYPAGPSAAGAPTLWYTSNRRRTSAFQSTAAGPAASARSAVSVATARAWVTSRYGKYRWLLGADRYCRLLSIDRTRAGRSVCIRAKSGYCSGGIFRSASSPGGSSRA